MAYRKGSREQKEAPSATLDHVLETVLRCPSLTVRQRGDVVSALRTVAKLLNRPLSAIPCNAPAIRGLLSSIKPALHGISPGRWANIRSLIGKGLDVAGVARRRSCDRSPISDAWSSLLAPLPPRPFRVALTPFARYSTRLGIEPSDVTQSIFDNYGDHLQQLSLRTRPRGALLDLRRAWNRAGEQAYPDWPSVRFAVVDLRPRYSAPWSDFPPSLKADVDNMVKDATRRISLSGHKPIRPASARAREVLLRALASAIVASGRDVSSLNSIADIVEVEAVAAGLEHILERLGGKNSAHVHQISKTVCTVARRWVKISKPHQERLEGIRQYLDPGRHGMTDKNRATLRMFEAPEIVARFDALPGRIWSKAATNGDLNVVEAIRLQVALAVELLTIAPVRIQNLASIDLERHIIDQDSGRQRLVHLFFSRGEVKNGFELEFELKRSTIALLDRYIHSVRPRLLRTPSTWLFPGEGAGHKVAPLLSAQIADLVEAEVGVRVTAHQFRHLAGYLFLKANPGAHEIVRQLLGHRSIATTLNFYAGMETAEALQHFDRHVDQRRSLAGRSAWRSGSA